MLDSSQTIDAIEIKHGLFLVFGLEHQINLGWQDIWQTLDAITVCSTFHFCCSTVTGLREMKLGSNAAPDIPCGKNARHHFGNRLLGGVDPVVLHARENK